MTGWFRIRLSMEDIVNGEQRFLVEAFRAVYGRLEPQGAALLGEKVLGQHDDFTCFYLTREAVEHCEGLCERYSFESSPPPVHDQVTVLAGDSRVLEYLVEASKDLPEPQRAPQLWELLAGWRGWFHVPQLFRQTTPDVGFYKFVAASVLVSLTVTVAHGVMQWKDLALSRESALASQDLEETLANDIERRVLGLFQQFGVVTDIEALDNPVALLGSSPVYDPQALAVPSSSQGLDARGGLMGVRGVSAAVRLDQPESALTPTASRPLVDTSSEGSGEALVVQVGAFRDLANAERLAKTLRPLDSEAWTYQLQDDLHAVRIGPFGERSVADEAAQTVQAATGLSPFVIAVNFE